MSRSFKPDDGGLTASYVRVSPSEEHIQAVSDIGIGGDDVVRTILLTATGDDVDSAVALCQKSIDSACCPVRTLNVCGIDAASCGIYFATMETLFGDLVWEHESGNYMLLRGPSQEWVIFSSTDKHLALLGKADNAICRSSPCEGMPDVADWQGAAVITAAGEASPVFRQACRAVAPAVHLWWRPLGQPKRHAWLYNEVAVRESYPATYFMVCGWRNGYFGIQDHGNAKGGYVLFSVWDHQSSMTPLSGNQSPASVNEEDRTEIVAQGEGVTAQRFGGEGTGGQSFTTYSWRLGQTCRLLVRCDEVDGGDRPRAIFSGYFHDPAQGKWRLLASFRVRVPKDQGASACNPYSFIEDWADNGGRRVGLWGPAWARDVDGEWEQLRDVRVTTTHELALNSRSTFLSGQRVGIVSGGQLLPASVMGPCIMPESELPTVLRDWPLPSQDGDPAPREDLHSLPLPWNPTSSEGASELQDVTILASSRWRVDYANGFVNVLSFSDDGARVSVEKRDPAGGLGTSDVTPVEGQEADGFAYRLEGHYAPGKYELIKFTGGHLVVKHCFEDVSIEGVGSRL